MRRILAISIGVMLVFGVVGIASGAGKEPQEKQKVGQEVSPPKPDLPEEASEKAKVKLEKVWERKFDEEIEDVAFEESEITVREAIKMGIKGLAMEKPRKKIRIPYPRMVVTKKSIKFLDKWGKIKKEYPIRETVAGKQCTKVKFPKNKKYIGILEQSFGDESKEGTRFIMLNQDGQPLWSLDNLAATYIHPSPNGKYAIGLGIGLRDSYLDIAPLFYNSRGLFKHEKDWPEHLEVRNIDFTDDGDFFALTAVHSLMRTAKTDLAEVPFAIHRGYLMLYDWTGKLHWKKELQVGDLDSDVTAHEAEISSDAEFVCVIGSLSLYDKLSEPRYYDEPREGKRKEHKRQRKIIWRKYKGSENYLLLFDKKGKLRWKRLVAKGDYMFKFSADKRFLLAICGRLSYLYLFEVNSGNIVWEFREANLPRFEGIATTPNLDFILIAAPQRKPKVSPEYRKLPDFVYLFDKDSNLLWKEEFPPNSLTAEINVKPNMSISRNGEWITVGTTKRTVTYRSSFAR